MTREEAINNLNMISVAFVESVTKEQRKIIDDTFDMAIEALEQEPKWIPVSERLPEESLNSVIGWDACRERCVFVQYINGHFQITGKNESFNLKAWMPLPEPYKGDKQNKFDIEHCRYIQNIKTGGVTAFDKNGNIRNITANELVLYSTDDDKSAIDAIRRILEADPGQQN